MSQPERVGGTGILHRSHLGKAGVLLLLVTAYFALYSLLPPRCRVETNWGTGGANWFGFAPGFAFFFAALVLVLLCSLRFLILAKVRCPADAFAWYVLLLASLLPAIWLLAVFDWDNEASSANANWIGTPVALLFVPTTFACLDLIARARLSVGWYAIRSLIEVLVLVPIWAFFWIVFGELLLLGWVGVP